jgi:hypothetical protein
MTIPAFVSVSGPGDKCCDGLSLLIGDYCCVLFFVQGCSIPDFSCNLSMGILFGCMCYSVLIMRF